MDFSECMSKVDDPKSCRDYRDDYLECLHHRKEVRPSSSRAIFTRTRHSHNSMRSIILPCDGESHLLLCSFLQYARLNAFFREDKRQREGGHHDGGGGHA